MVSGTVALESVVDIFRGWMETEGAESGDGGRSERLVDIVVVDVGAPEVRTA